MFILSLPSVESGLRMSPGSDKYMGISLMSMFCLLFDGEFKQGSSKYKT